jgi:uncharacterized protein YjbI with pentapeptide repeats
MLVALVQMAFWQVAQQCVAAKSVAPLPKTLDLEDYVREKHEIGRQDLVAILERHKQWLSSNGNQGTQAEIITAKLNTPELLDVFVGADLRMAKILFCDLRGANLKGANLVGADLRRTALHGTLIDDQTKLDSKWAMVRQITTEGAAQKVLKGLDISWADLSHADLQKADLSDTKLESSDLTFGNLDGATLDGAFMATAVFYATSARGASFKGAQLLQAKMVRTDFAMADFSGASFWKADMRDSYFVLANLKDVIFQPDFLPPIDNLSLVSGVRELRVGGDPGPLSNLRDQAKENGLRQLERDASCAIQRTDNADRPWLYRTINYILFDLTCEYGASPGRPLIVLMWAILPFAIVYAGILLVGKGSNLWVVWPKESACKPEGYEGAISARQYFRIIKGRPTLKLLRLAFYFSLLSAFHIGWREMNVGSWISRLQASDYQLASSGSLRRISGLQALLSLYLLALWVLSYFGRPFE